MIFELLLLLAILLFFWPAASPTSASIDWLCSALLEICYNLDQIPNYVLKTGTSTMRLGNVIYLDVEAKSTEELVREAINELAPVLEIDEERILEEAKRLGYVN